MTETVSPVKSEPANQRESNGILYGIIPCVALGTVKSETKALTLRVAAMSLETGLAVRVNGL